MIPRLRDAMSTLVYSVVHMDDYDKATFIDVSLNTLCDLLTPFALTTSDWNLPCTVCASNGGKTFLTICHDDCPTERYGPYCLRCADLIFGFSPR